MSMKNKYCQSCGMPMKKDPIGGGSNSDGSINPDFCSYCFENGKFTQENITADEMQKFVIGKMKEMGFPGFLAKFFAKGIPKLKRWNSN